MHCEMVFALGCNCFVRLMWSTELASKKHGLLASDCTGLATGPGVRDAKHWAEGTACLTTDTKLLTETWSCTLFNLTALDNVATIEVDEMVIECKFATSSLVSYM